MPTTDQAATSGIDLADAHDEYVHIDLHLIVASRTNPRKTFDQVKLQELADSIASTGVSTPIIVRPLPAERVEETSAGRRGSRPAYEIVAGERRYRASLLAGVDTIPAIVRRLTDVEALEAQLTENQHRKDLSPLEEAEGFDYYMQQTGMTGEQIGARFGMSKSHVYAQLKLLDLAQAPRKALLEGKIDASKALLIARIPDEGLQGKALADITRTGYYNSSPMSEREAREHIRQNYMLDLSRAKFKITDFSLVPEAGACRDCTKRTGHAPDLFSDVKGADVCIDPPCFHKKEQAQAEQTMLEAKAKGQTVIAGKEAAELVTSGYQSKLKGYKRLDSTEDSPTDQPLRKIIGAQMKAEGIEPVMIENPRKAGDLIATLPNDVVLRLLKTVAGQAAESTKVVAKEVKQFAAEKQAKADEKAKARYEQEWRDQLLARTWAHIRDGNKPIFNMDVHRLLTTRAVARLSVEQTEAVAELLGLEKVGAHSALHDFAETTPDPDLLHALVIMQQDVKTSDYSYVNSERINNRELMLIAGIALGDNLAVVTHEVQQLAHAKYFPKETPTSGGRKKATPADASQGDLPPAPAAQAKTTRGEGGKGKKDKGPASQDRGVAAPKRKTTAEEAVQGIAAAMQGIEASAPADARPVVDVDSDAAAAGDTDQGSADALQGNVASAGADARPSPTRVAAMLAWPFPGTKPATSPASPDTLVARAKAVVVREQKASVRLLKAELQIGHDSARAVLDELETAGVVSACGERGARKVLVAA